VHGLVQAVGPRGRQTSSSIGESAARGQKGAPWGSPLPLDFPRCSVSPLSAQQRHCAIARDHWRARRRIGHVDNGANPLFLSDPYLLIFLFLFPLWASRNKCAAVDITIF